VHFVVIIRPHANFIEVRIIFIRLMKYSPYSKKIKTPNRVKASVMLSKKPSDDI
jgi:hypothetical protein